MPEDDRKRFEQVLKPGTRIPHWSADGNDRIGSFVVAKIDHDRIWIEEPKRYIRWPDFYRVYAVWSNYRRRVIPRTKITELTGNSTYVISILNWLESK